MRSAVQKQLEDVQKGLRGMKEAEKSVKEIKVSMGEVEQLYQQCSELSEVVRPIKEVNKRHQQVCKVWLEYSHACPFVLPSCKVCTSILIRVSACNNADTVKTLNTIHVKSLLL